MRAGTGTEPGLSTVSESGSSSKGGDKPDKADKSGHSKSPLSAAQPASLLAHIVSRLLHALDAPSSALSAAACRTTGGLPAVAGPWHGKAVYECHENHVKETK